MTIKRGEEWGRRVAAPRNLVVVSSDAEIAQLPSTGVIAVRGGDLWHALGKPTLVSPGDQCTEVDIDGLEVTVTRPDGSTSLLLAASSVEIGRWFGPGAYVAVLNSGFCGDLNLAPRSHPNDGRLDVFHLTAGTSLVQRLLIRRRASIGSHLPHPAITVSATEKFAMVRPTRHTRLVLDGINTGSWISVSIACLSDHWRLVL